MIKVTELFTLDLESKIKNAYMLPLKGGLKDFTRQKELIVEKLVRNIESPKEKKLALDMIDRLLQSYAILIQAQTYLTCNEKVQDIMSRTKEMFAEGTRDVMFPFFKNGDPQDSALVR